MLVNILTHTPNYKHTTQITHLDSQPPWSHETKTISSKSSKCRISLARNLTLFSQAHSLEEVVRQPTPFSLLYTSLIVIAANRWLSAQAGRISGATIAQNINSSLRSVPLTGPSRGGMFGCIAVQAHIIVIPK